MTVVKKAVLSKFTIPALVLMMFLCVINICYNVGVAHGEELKARELALRQTAIDDYQEFTTRESIKCNFLLHISPYWIVRYYTDQSATEFEELGTFDHVKFQENEQLAI